MTLPPPVALTLVPPGPITDQIDLEIRGCVRNLSARPQRFNIRIAVDDGADAPLFDETVELTPGEAHGLSLRWSTCGQAGEHELAITAGAGPHVHRATRQLRVLASDVRSTRRISGAWLGLLHWSEIEGAKWNDTLRTFSDDDWREQVRGMHEIGFDLITVQETWRNPTYYGRHYHQMTADNYRETFAGKAFYPSSLWPVRMDLPADDALAAVLDEADQLDMHVMLGVGMYAHFDYTPGSLAWHKDVVTELWQRYGHHPSLYGWYIAEELSGRIKPHEVRYWDATDQFRDEVVTFFREFTAHCASFAPDKVVMVAPDAHYQHDAADIWPQLARHCNILCVQGYQRAPDPGVAHEQSIAILQDVCDQAGAHLWMDMEIFGFEHPDKVGPQVEQYAKTFDDGADEFVHVPLVPQRIETCAASLRRFTQLECVIAYQYPGILCAPQASKRPGGGPAVRLFEDYQRYLQGLTDH